MSPGVLKHFYYLNKQIKNKMIDINIINLSFKFLKFHAD